jgi:hypothetical protein
LTPARRVVDWSGRAYSASCPELGLTARGLGAACALDALRDEIRYRLELCPCTSVDEDFVQLDIHNG